MLAVKEQLNDMLAEPGSDSVLRKWGTPYGVLPTAPQTSLQTSLSTDAALLCTFPALFILKVVRLKKHQLVPPFSEDSWVSQWSWQGFTGKRQAHRLGLALISV